MFSKLELRIIMGNARGVSAFIYVMFAGIVLWGVMNSYLRKADLVQFERTLKKQSFATASTQKLLDDIIRNTAICTPNFKYRKLGEQLESLRLGHALSNDQIIPTGTKLPGTNVIFLNAQIAETLDNFNPATGMGSIKVHIKFREEASDREQSLAYNFNVSICNTYEYLMTGKDWNVFDATENFRQTCTNERGSGWQVDEESVIEVEKNLWMATCRNLSFCGPEFHIERCN